MWFAEHTMRLSQEQRLHFYEVLARNLTVITRTVGCDSARRSADKVERMVWINQMLLRVVKKVRSQRIAPGAWTEEDFGDAVESCIQLDQGGVGRLVEQAIRDSYRVVTNGEMAVTELTVNCPPEKPGAVEVWRPNANHESYRKHPAYLQWRFNVRPVQELCLARGVMGVARLVVMPAFTGESVYTFVYRDDEVSIQVCRAASSLWYSLGGADWTPPEPREYTQALDTLPAPLNRWRSLKETAHSAPTVKVAIIDGREYGTLDGVGYRHHVADTHTDLDAEWNNPTESATNHVLQVRLVKAYEHVVQSCAQRG